MEGNNLNYNLSNFNTATRNTEIGLAENFTEELNPHIDIFQK